VTPGKVENASPIIGEHNEYVLRSILGYSDEQINLFKKRNV
jgi:crotonobetainyl-CoA:carnitine CoA-transferase CaiB-like acyl-CoA transferase